MANRHFHLNDEQVNELKRYEQQSTRSSGLKHLQVVRLYGTASMMSEIIDIVGYGKSSVLRNWATHYSEAGVIRLRANYERSSQNARKLSVEQELCETLRQYRYSYTGGNPINRVDRNGMCWENANATPEQ
mgnify:CR=1 FL=1